MSTLDHVITSQNIDEMLATYVDSAETLGSSISGLTGMKLLEALKRDAVGQGPYPKVSLFEAANRIMTDLVILIGVRHLLRARVFPFASYSVEFGHGNKQEHDLVANAGSLHLIGEAFNVSPSFFPTKKHSVLKKLRHSSIEATTSVIMCNHDAVRDTYAPQLRVHECLILVDVGLGTARAVPNNALQRTQDSPSIK